MKMETAFYAGLSNPDLRNVRLPADQNGLDVHALMTKLQSAPPEIVAALASLFQGIE